MKLTQGHFIMVWLLVWCGCTTNLCHFRNMDTVRVVFRHIWCSVHCGPQVEFGRWCFSRKTRTFDTNQIITLGAEISGGYRPNTASNVPHKWCFFSDICVFITHLLYYSHSRFCEEFNSSGVLTWRWRQRECHGNADPKCSSNKVGCSCT